MSRARPLLPCALLLLLVGCATLNESSEAGEPDYSEDAETNMARGNQAFASRNFLDAEKFYEHVRTKYPFLEASKEAELRLADTHFEREKYAEARDAYQSFIKLHPTHPRVDYAAFRAALTHHKDIPSDFFVLPPSYEKDQSEVKSAVRSLQDFVRSYPKSGYVKEAEEAIASDRKLLAQHELYVADFYAKREKWGAVIARYDRVVREFPGLGYDDKAQFGMYYAYLKLNDTQGATRTLEQIIARNEASAVEAKRLLGK